MGLEHINQNDISPLNQVLLIFNAEDACVSQIEDAFVEIMVMKSIVKFILRIPQNTAVIILIEGTLG